MAPASGPVLRKNCAKGILSIALMLIPGAVFAAEPVAVAPIDFSTYRPTASATRISPEEAPIIDGDLSDPIWARAEIIDEFYQQDPGTGEPGTERTEVRVLHDGENLYFYVYNYDSEPENIVVNIKTRDGNQGNGDFFRIYLDPMMTRRNGYGFEINPAGARTDTVLQNNISSLNEWDTIWAAQARIVDDGWVAEVMIPFRSLTYDPARTEWGFDFQRIIRRKNERIRWTSISAATRFEDISRSGTLTNVTPEGGDLGLEIQTYERASYRYSWEGQEEGSLFGRFGGNIYYRITPGLTGTLTFNPDFSDAPLDERLVNTTRFQLFQPETRDFFLQDVATFEFGGYGFFESENGRPFFSRNIGLSDGRPVAIVGGGKLSGEVGGIGVGALTAVTSGTGSTNRSQVLSVARLTAPVLSESKAGIIVTNGDPTGNSDNTVTGMDFQYRNSDIGGGKILQTDVFFQRSFSSTRGDDDALGLGIDFPNEPWGGFFRFKQIGNDFTPALGFVNRRGIRQYNGEVLYRDRSLGFRWVDAGTTFDLYTDLNGEVRSRFNELRTGVNHNFNFLYAKLRDYYENVVSDFDLPGEVPVYAGKYGWTNLNLLFQSQTGMPFRARLEVECCRFYNGDYFKGDVRLEWRPNTTVIFLPNYTYTWIELPTGHVAIHVFAANLILNFTPDMAFRTQVQYDNISEAFSLSARFNWEYEPGQEIFAAFGQSALISEGTFVGQVSQLSLRLGQTFRF
jgi:hypothetical protein